MSTMVEILQRIIATLMWVEESQDTFSGPYGELRLKLAEHPLRALQPYSKG